MSELAILALVCYVVIGVIVGICHDDSLSSDSAESFWVAVLWPVLLVLIVVVLIGVMIAGTWGRRRATITQGDEHGT